MCIMHDITYNTTICVTILLQLYKYISNNLYIYVGFYRYDSMTCQLIQVVILHLPRFLMKRVGAIQSHP